jgi:hypothetical protein
MGQVDEATCSTPRRREINIPDSQSIRELVTPLEDLVTAFWDSRTPTKLAVNGNGKQQLAGSTTPETQRSPSCRDKLGASLLCRQSFRWWCLGIEPLKSAVGRSMLSGAC